MLRDYFLEVLNKYPERGASRAFLGKPLSEVLSKKIVSEISNIINIDKKFKIKVEILGLKGSISKICITKAEAKTSKQKGIFIEFIFADNGKYLYLTLNQRSKDILKELGIVRAITVMDNTAEAIIKKIKQPNGFKTNREIKTGDLLTDVGCIFYKCYLKNEIPNDYNLQIDLINLIELYDKCVDKFIAISTLCQMDDEILQSQITENEKLGNSSYKITNQSTIEEDENIEDVICDLNFYKWLIKYEKLNSTEAKAIINELLYISINFLESYSIKDNILEIKKLGVFNQAVQEILMDEDFINYDKKSKGECRNALVQYRKYLISNSDETTTSDSFIEISNSIIPKGIELSLASIEERNVTTPKISPVKVKEESKEWLKRREYSKEENGVVLPIALIEELNNFTPKINKIKVKENFMEWLKRREYSKEEANNNIMFIDIASESAMKLKLIGESFFSTINSASFKKSFEIVTNDKMFRTKNYNNYKWVWLSLKRYETFLKEQPENHSNKNG